MKVFFKLDLSLVLWTYLNNISFFEGEGVGVMDITVVFDRLSLNTETGFWK